jgi:ATP-binding cassette subfamily F protein 3
MGRDGPICMINIDNISKSYGAQEIFREASCQINAGERVGLVGRNGQGKTTLFRLISGKEELDGGTISVPRGYSIGYVEQEPDFTESTVLGEGCRGLPAAERHHHWKVEKILAGLGFSEADLAKHPSELSGGFQVRLNLAKALAREHDLLLLDEPNNYLDITSIRWLTRFLNGWRGELILVTHDRSFMDNVATDVVGIYRKTLRKIKGDTGKLYSQMAMDEEVYERTRLKDERKREQVEAFIRRFRAKARLASRVQSRIKALEKRQPLEKLESAKDLDFSFVSRPSNGKTALTVKGLTFGFEEGRPLFRDLSFTVGPNDRVCVVGKNGKGKTTLLRTIAGEIAPLSGEVRFNATAATAYYAQGNIAALDPEKTVVEEISSAAPDVTEQRARNIAGMMMFEGDAALKKVKVLSGGEKNRLMLGRIIATPVNLLLLDEPTNHLDMESCDALLEALDDFEGAVLMVTHNEMLLHGLARKLVVFQGGGAGVFEGSYGQFLEDRGWDDEKQRGEGESPAEAGQQKPDKKAERREMRKLRADLSRERAKVLGPLKERVTELETRIANAEAALQGLYAAIEAAAKKGDGEAITELSVKIHNCKKEIDSTFERLESASAVYDRERSLFWERLRDLDSGTGKDD